MRRLALRLLLLLVAVALIVAMGARHLRPTPDLLAIVVGAIAVRGGWRTGAAVGLVGGWLLDLMPPGSGALGTWALTYAAAGAVAGHLNRPGPAPRGWVVLAALVTAAAVTAVVLVLALARAAPVDWPALGLSLLATTTLALVLGPLVLRLDGLGAHRD